MMYYVCKSPMISNGVRASISLPTTAYDSDSEPSVLDGTNDSRTRDSHWHILRVLSVIPRPDKLFINGIST